VQQLTIKNLYFKYKTSTLPIFENLCVDFDQGWSCLVGANGSGKSTLLQLISKKISFEDGVIKGNDLVHYCMQSTQYPPETLDDFMLTFTGKSFKIRDLLNIKDEWLYRWDDLSCGERKRLQLAVALFDEPDVLLVDEPTNHLDIKSKEIVLQALKSFKAIGILVSHDRELLDNLSQSTFILKHQNIMTFKTPFSNAMNEYNTNLVFLDKNQEKQNAELKKLKKSIQNQHEKVSQSKKRMSKKDLGKNDKNAKTKIDLARFTGKDKNDGQELAKLKAKENKIQSNAIKTDKTYALGIEFNTTKYTNIFPVHIKKKTLELSETKRLSFGELFINRYDKIGIIGENGAGKTSFLNNMFTDADLKSECLYIPQEISEEESKALFVEINDLPNDVKGEIFTLIRQLSSDPIKLQDSFLPSPGEIKKLMIAKGLLNSPSLIILDEPTNHMDLDSIISLENALQEYDGTMVIISHDMTFLHTVVSDIWELKKENDDLFRLETQIVNQKKY